MGLRSRTATVLAVSLTVLSSWNCGLVERSSASGPAGLDACAVALAPAAGQPSNDRDRAIERLKQDTRTSVDSRDALEGLAYRYVARARAANDPGDYTLAERTATCLAARYPEAASAELLRGHVLHQLHRFREAEEVARRLVARREFVLDYGLLGDALMDQGNLAEAAAAYQKMIDLKPFYQSYTRAAHLRWLRGDLEGAIDMIRLAIQAGSPRDPESVAWAYTRLAIYELQRGHVAEATAAVDSALTYQPDYAPALLERGRVLLAGTDPSVAIDALQRAATLNPLPEYQWVLADALRSAGRESDAVQVETSLMAHGRDADPRTFALFLATRRTSLDEAMRVAERELDTRRDIFTLDAVAWTLAAGGRLAEAGDAMTRALAEGTQDGRLFLHAAAIAERQGRRDAARAWSAKAEAFRATLLPSERAELERVRQRVAGTTN